MMARPGLRVGLLPLAARLVLAAALSIGLAGCGGGNRSAGDLETELPPAAACAGDLPPLTQRVYVAANGSDAADCGQTIATACQSIAQGIARCAASGCAVLVRHGLYRTTQTIALRDGVGVYGGCRFDGEADRQYRTVIDAAPAPGTPAVSAQGVNSPTVFDGIVVLGKEEAAGGVASIAMAVSDGSGLTLSRTVLVAGRGGDGAPLDPPPVLAARSGSAGDTTSFTPGGQGQGGGSCEAGGVAGRGGDGSARRQNTISQCGDFACNCTPTGGLAGSDGAATGSIAGGAGGGPGTQGNACWERVIRQGTGGTGSAGLPGSAGGCSVQGGAASAEVWGRFEGTAWLPGAGGAGGSGAVGSGGGGGGPGGMCTLLTVDTRQWFPYWGQPGGGGGAGGCGGQGGFGGQQGGASVVLLLSAASMVLDPASLSIVGGQGGRGGAGGTGGVGSVGGAGGAGGNSGGNCSIYDANVNIGWGGPGGAGGSGGSGGAGSGGSGGNGGPSIGIALVSGASAPGAGGVYPGFAGAGADGGAGGAGGANGCSGATGAGGTAGGMTVLRTF